MVKQWSNSPHTVVERLFSDCLFTGWLQLVDCSFKTWLEAGDTLLALPWQYVRKGTVDFAVASFVALLIALMTVNWQAIRAAIAKPVDSLRDE